MTIFCSACRSANKNDDAFCTNCGARLGKEDEIGGQSIRENYFRVMKERLRADGVELLYGHVKIPKNGGNWDGTIGFFKSPKKIAGNTYYFLIIMSLAETVSKQNLESFIQDAGHMTFTFLGQWQHPPEYDFLERGRLAPEGSWRTFYVAERVSVLGSSVVDEDAKRWIMEQEIAIPFTQAIVDLARGQVYLNRAPHHILGSSTLIQVLQKYLSPSTT